LHPRLSRVMVTVMSHCGGGGCPLDEEVAG